MSGHRSTLVGGSLMYAGVAIGVLETSGPGPFLVLLLPPAVVAVFAVRRWRRARRRGDGWTAREQAVSPAEQRFLDGLGPMPAKRAVPRGGRHR